MNALRRFKELKSLSKEEFVSKIGDDNLYDVLQKSKEGRIVVSKISNNPGNIQRGDVYSGWTNNFAEGMSLWITSETNWFHTSIVQKINWKDNSFKTANSTYRFSFEETSIPNELYESID